jgi:hypothetical protein
MGSELMTAAAHGVTSKWCMRVRPAVSAQCMATPPMTHGGQATMGSKPMKSTAPAAMPAATTTPSAMPGDCGGIRDDDAKRAHRDACRQNAYRSLLHRLFPTRSSKAVGVPARATTARTSPHPTFNYCGGVTTSWPVTYRSEREGKGSAPMKGLSRLLLASTLAVVQLLACIPSDAARRVGGSPYDGTWSVAIYTLRGDCGSVRVATRIVGGRVYSQDQSYQSNGVVGANGAIRVSVAGFGRSATGSGRLSNNSGAGRWRSFRGECSGSWSASRRAGYQM